MSLWRRGKRPVCTALGCLCLSAGLLLRPLAGAAQPNSPKDGLPDRIVAIRFVGNETTQESILRQEMTLGEGDRVSAEAIAKSRQAIMNLGLFKSVSTQLQPRSDGYLLIVEVQEKYYILPIPRVDSKADGRYSYGLELRFDNLLGLNQRLNLLYRHKDALNGDFPLQKEAGIEYIYPRVVSTPYRLDVQLRTVHEIVDEGEDQQVVGRAELDTETIGLRLSRWLIDRGPTRGWRVGGGLLLVQRDFEVEWGTGAFRPDRSVSTILTADYEDVYEYKYHQEGVRYGYASEFALSGLGSDYRYARHTLYYTRYQPTSLARYSNLNWRLQAGLADGFRFGDPAFSLGGGDTLRGHKTGSVEGDAMLLANVQYLHPVARHPFLRLAAFVDVGNAYPRVGDIDLTDLKAGAGIGLRWRVQSLVDVTLNVDWAVDLESGGSILYASTSRTF